MKILHVIHSVDPRGGGPIEGIKQHAAPLAKHGVVMDVMSLDAPGASWAVDFPLPLFTTGPSHLVYGYTPRAIPWLKKNHENYDAVITHGPWQYNSLAVWLALKTSRTPYYIYPHGMLDPWFKQRYPLKHLKKSFYWPWAAYQILRDAAAVLFTCEEERLQARKSFWPYRCREVIDGYGISNPSGDRSRQRALFLETYAELKGKRLILFLGRVHEKKGCDLLLRAWKEILLSSPADKISDVHLVIAGPADDEYGAAMKKLARDLGLEQKASWTGMLVDDFKWGSFLAADIFVLPSHQENFGISIAEALACSVPVLISNKVNIWREILEDNAGMVENDDLAGTVRLLRRWIDLEGAQKEKMRTNAHMCFKTRFDLTKTVGVFTGLLERDLRAAKEVR